MWCWCFLFLFIFSCDFAYCPGFWNFAPGPEMLPWMSFSYSFQSGFNMVVMWFLWDLNAILHVALGCEILPRVLKCCPECGFHLVLNMVTIWFSDYLHTILHVALGSEILPRVLRCCPECGFNLVFNMVSSCV